MLGNLASEPTVRFHSRPRLKAVTDRRWMEQLMIKGARFTLEEFRRLFLGTRRALASELLWASYDRNRGRESLPDGCANQDGWPRYFVLEESASFETPAGEFIGIPYVTELGELTRHAASRLLGEQSILQLRRPIFRGGLDALAEDALWTVRSADALRCSGFERASDVARGALRRRYHFRNQAFSFVLVPRSGTHAFFVATANNVEAIPHAVINEFLFDVVRALIPGQERGYPLRARVNASVVCSLCADSIGELDEAVIYQRAHGASTRLAALHPSCQPFSLAGQFLRAGEAALATEASILGRS